MYQVCRIEYLKQAHIAEIDFLVEPSDKEVIVNLLPSQVYWVNTMGAYLNQNTNDGLVVRAYVRLFPSFIILAKTPYMEGPYLSEEHLKTCSLAYNLIINPNPSKAVAIVLQNIARRHKDRYLSYFTDEFIGILPYIIEHTFVGNYRNGYVTGVHFQTSDVRLKKPINSSIQSKSPFFLIEKINPLTDEVVVKNAPSTFWPQDWEIEKCIIECAIAWNNKILATKDIYIGTTSNGLKVKFCYKGGKLKTVYPDEGNNR